MRQMMKFVGLGLVLSGPAFAGGHGHGGGHGFGWHTVHQGGFDTGHSRTFGASAANAGFYARGVSSSFRGGYGTHAYAGPRFYRTPGTVATGYAGVRYSYGTPYRRGLGYGTGSDYGYAGYPTNFAAPGVYYPGGYGQDYGDLGAGYGPGAGGCSCR